MPAPIVRVTVGVECRHLAVEDEARNITVFNESGEIVLELVRAAP